jgi:hypothetical protein
VLKLQQDTASAERTTVKRDESVTGTLSEVGKYVEIVLESRADAIMLWMRPPDDRFLVYLGHFVGEPVQSTANFQKDSAQETKLRDFIARRGLKALEDSGIPPSVLPGLPVDFIYEFSPLPSDEASLSELIIDLFEHVCGARGDTELRFHCFEVGDAA